MAFREKRRSFLLSLASVGISHALLQGRAQAQAAAPRGYVLGPNEGEHLTLRGSDIFINMDPTRGSSSFTMGTQRLLVGAGIPIHRHFQTDEALYVIEGSGTFILDDARHPIETGGTIFIPKNTWHGFENADRELHLLWIVAPPGLEAFFRDVASPPSVPPNSLTKVQLNEIAHKHAMEFK